MKRRCYYVPMVPPVEGEGYRVSVVVEGEDGHHPTGTWPFTGAVGETRPYFWGPTWGEAISACRHANAAMGLDAADMLAIATSAKRGEVAPFEAGVGVGLHWGPLAPAKRNDGLRFGIMRLRYLAKVYPAKSERALGLLQAVDVLTEIAHCAPPTASIVQFVEGLDQEALDTWLGTLSEDEVLRYEKLLESAEREASAARPETSTLVRLWNTAVPIGTPVRFDDERSSAWTASAAMVQNGEAVVVLKGVLGVQTVVPLTTCQVIKQQGVQ